MTFWEDDCRETVQHFGRLAVLNGTNYDHAEVTVILDDDHRGVLVAEGAVESTMPIATAVSADVEDAVHGDTLTFQGLDNGTDRVYYVRGKEADGMGTTRLILSKV